MIKIARQRSKILQEIRNFFNSQNFTEVETPILIDIPGMEPHLNPFEINFKSPHSKNHKLYLNTSPELQMKKLLGAGFKNIYQLTKVFRNGETGGPLHNPEFTMLEWYRTNANYKDIMDDCEKLILNLTGAGQAENISSIPQAPWPRKTTNELFIEHCGIDLTQNKTYEEFKQTAKKANFETIACNTWDDIFFKLFLNHIEPHLPTGPIFIYDYPSTQAALAKKSKKNPFFAERFELYINGIELANAFSELIDPNEQLKRLMQEQKERKSLKKTVFPIDDKFLEALKQIKQPAAGIALGVDRLIMILLNKKSIQETLLFPFCP